MTKRTKAPLSILLLMGLFTLAGCGQDESATDNSSTLASARAAFQTNIIDTSFVGDGQPATPPKSVFNLIDYPAKDGQMAAYVTPDPQDGKKHPAVIWLIGGYGGIGNDDFFWQPQPRDNDQTGSAFRKAGLVMMVPSFRAENANPGRYEMFYGELDDLEAARVWLAQQPYVDPQRIYLVGHSTGGTRALLASELSSAYRAVFSLGGIPDLKKRVEGGRMMVKVPFNQNNAQEFKLRSPQFFVTSITTPTFYFEGQESYWSEFDEMKDVAKRKNVPFYTYMLRGGDHFNIISPVTEAIAEKILADGGDKTNITFDKADINRIEKNIGQ